MGVSAERPGRNEASLDQFSRHDAQDRPMVAAALLAFQLALPTECEGRHHGRAPDREETWVRQLFEKAIAGFYRVNIPLAWRVFPGGTMRWPVEQPSGGIGRILPTMRTDIVLENRVEGRRIVIDTKFTSILKSGWHRTEGLRSGYVYQIFAYLRSQEGSGDPLAAQASGLLLHPSVGEMVDEWAVIQGHLIRFATVDLAADARTIRGQLLQILDPPTRTGRTV
jgi:5-methylcytosine-specific restriction enzyme subunit McrC